MNHLTAQHFFRIARRWGALLAVLLAASGGKAADAPEPGRFLLLFETSPGLKKNLPALKQTLDALFASNLQHEMQENDDLAVWTVDQELHTGTFPLASWAPAEAETYSARLKDFLGRQKFSPRASLGAVQPLLNRVIKNSERLTVLIFCDEQSRLLGTPYDSGVNEIITNALTRTTVTRTKAEPQMFVLVLRSYQGEYLGCSVNRSAPLNFPKFPPPPSPKPEPPPIKPPPAIAPVAAPPPVVVQPVPALIIVGTNASTNLAALTKSSSQPPPQPAPQPTVPPATIAPVTNPPVPKPIIIPAPSVAAPATSQAAASNPTVHIEPAPVPVPSIPKNPAPVPSASVSTAPSPIATAPAAPVATNPPATTNAAAVAIPAADTAPDSGFKNLILISGAMLAVALGLVIWLALRARRPRGSLITSSMQDDSRLPPR